jgi:hypothetical protein
MPSLRCRPAALLLLVLPVAACTFRSPVTVSPREFVEKEHPPLVRVTLTDGRQVRIENPIVLADSIRAAPPCERVFMPDGRAPCRGAPAPIPLAEVRSMSEEADVGSSGRCRHDRQGSDGTRRSLQRLYVPLVLCGLGTP